MKKTFYLILIAVVLLFTCSCALLQKPIDNRTGFSNHLKQTENNIRSEEWEKAKSSLDECIKAWKKVKPLLQIDIDHDYVNSMEEDFIKLDGYIDCKEKADSLATILLVEDTWKNIGSL
jgi:hypothetical protein